MRVRSSSRLVCRLALLPMAFLLLGGTPGRNAAAQSVVHDSVRTKLASQVHLAMGATTLKEVMQSLSEQTKISIEAADYLQQHKLVLCLNNVSAETALNTLAQANHWQWHETPQQGVLLTRPKVVLPEKGADVSLALQSILPPDYQRFLGVPGYMRDAMYHDHSDAATERSRSGRMANDNQSTPALAEEWKKRLRTLLEPSLETQPSLSFLRMSEDQQHSLLVVLVLQSLAGINSGTGHDLLQGVLRPYERDPQSAELKLRHDNLFMIGTTKILGPDRQQSTGFGVQARLDTTSKETSSP